MTPFIPGTYSLNALTLGRYSPTQRTASELKLKRVQDTPPDSTFNDTAFFGIGIDMTSGTAHEAADRALSSVARKLDKSLSVEYTVNELIAEATDLPNLANIYHGESLSCPLVHGLIAVPQQDGAHTCRDNKPSSSSLNNI